MQIFVFILLAGVWAAFLLPSFFDNRRQGPMATTRSFARSTALLASVASVPARREIMMRQRAMQRRRRILVGLATGAIATLGLAVWQGSVLLLGFTVAFDVAIAAYIGLLLHLKQEHARTGLVVEMPPIETVPAETVDRATVRVVAG